MSSYLNSMPILLHNLGVEMIYILVQRLKAQNITSDKSIKVIQDVVGSLFDKNFLSEIKRKHEIGKHASIRQLFEKLAHSSIMRLNSSSMSKLFDLMLMAFKYQLLRMKFPEELFQVTLNHLNSLVDILNSYEGANPLIINSVKEEIGYINSNYSNLSCFDFIILRQTLLRFFQGRNVKVSLFIQENLQSNNGLIYLPMDEQAPPQTYKPGVFKILSNSKVVKEGLVNLQLTQKYKSYQTEKRMGIVTTDLGYNLYTKSKRPKENEDQLVKEKVEQSLKTNISTSGDSNIQKIIDNPHRVQDSPEAKHKTEITKKEFKDWADLINIDNSNSSQSTFKIDLFPDKKKGDKSAPDEIYFDILREESDNVKKIKGAFEDFLEDGNNEDEPDLLELMDLASKK